MLPQPQTQVLWLAVLLGQTGTASMVPFEENAHAIETIRWLVRKLWKAMGLHLICAKQNNSDGQQYGLPKSGST